MRCAYPECSHDQPLLPDVGVIALVPDRWEDTWQTRHHLLTRLARYFNIVWCNPAQGWRESWIHRAPVITQPAQNHDAPPNFTIYESGRWLPLLYRPAFLARYTAKQRLKQASRVLRRRGCKRLILYLWRFTFVTALDLIEHDISCYHVDDEYSFSTSEQPIDQLEAKVLSRADQVFIHSPALFAKKGHFNSHTLFVPNGVDYRAYATPQAEPLDLKKIPRPRIGYVGMIKDQLDFALLATLARDHRDWSFVFVGPVGERPLGDCAALLQQLSEYPNVHFLGKKPVETLPAYTQHLDVCMMCYKINKYTKYIYPLKLHEYLAAGRPVIGAPIDTLREFGHIVNLAATTEDWSKAVEKCLDPTENTSSRIAERRATAQRYDWNDLAQLLAKTLCDRLGSPYRTRFEEALGENHIWS